MPRPANGRDLIAVAAGAPDFRRGDWWSAYKEARVFIPRGFSDAMAGLELNSVEQLQQYTGVAASRIQQDTNWTTQQLAVRGHWVDCPRPQLTRAAGEKAMLLTKAVLAMESLQLYANHRGKPFDVYDSVQIIPAAYRPVGFDLEYMLAQKEASSAAFTEFMIKARALGQDFPELLLRDLAKGEHGTFAVADLVREVFTDREITVRYAERPGKRGVSPASDYCQA